MQQTAGGGLPARFLQRMNVPTDLAAVARLAVRFIDIGFEVGGDPFAGFQKGEIDDAFEDAARTLERDREFAMDAWGLAYALEQGMPQGIENRERRGLDFVFVRRKKAAMGFGQLQKRFF